MGNIDFWKKWIALQLKHNLDKMCELSIKNFHFPGLNYVCFEFTPAQTIRLYIVNPVDNLDTENVNIHNHLYDSQLLCLKGWIKNTTYRLNADREDYNLYELTSALHPENVERKIKLRPMSRYGLDIVGQKILRPGDTHFQPHTEIHNVANDPASLTAFMVFEFPTVKTHSIIFTKKEFNGTIDTPGCYERYTKGEMQVLVGSLLEQL